MKPHVEANSDVLAKEPSRSAANVDARRPAPACQRAGRRANRCRRSSGLRRDIDLDVRLRRTVAAAQVAPALSRPEVERDLRRHCGHRRRSGDVADGGHGAAYPHEVDAEADARNTKLKGIHVGTARKSEGALGRKRVDGYGRIERHAAGRAGHRAAQINDVRAG